MMDLTPKLGQDRRIVQAYGDGGFRISGEAHKGSVLVFPDRVEPWPVATLADLSLDSLQSVLDSAADVDLLLIGCGSSMGLIKSTLRQPLRDAGVVVEPMDTGAACRTYNVLLLEERRVAAALIAV